MQDRRVSAATVDHLAWKDLKEIPARKVDMVGLVALDPLGLMALMAHPDLQEPPVLLDPPALADIAASPALREKPAAKEDAGLADLLEQMAVPDPRERLELPDFPERLDHADPVGHTDPVEIWAAQDPWDQWDHRVSKARVGPAENLGLVAPTANLAQTETQVQMGSRACQARLARKE